MKKGLVLLLLTVVIVAPSARSTCDVESLNSNLDDLVERSLTLGQSTRPNVTLNGRQIVCLSTSTMRGLYASASVVVNCTGAGPSCPDGGGLQQFDFNCMTEWNPNPSDGNFAAPDGADLTTSLRTDCGTCQRIFMNNTSINFDFDRYDPATHCVACTSNCNTGLMQCSGVFDDQCCNGVVNNTCVANCTSPERPLAMANYTCTVFCDPLADLPNGSISLSNGDLQGSVATHMCVMNFELQGSENRTCEISGDVAEWSGNAPTCMAVTSTMAATSMGPTTEMDMTSTDAGNMTTPGPLVCDVLSMAANQLISYSDNCNAEINCQAMYSCEDGYRLMDGASVRTCSLPSDGVPVWSGIAPRCIQQSDSLTQAELAGIGIAVAVVGAAVLIIIVVIIILVLSRR